MSVHVEHAKSPAIVRVIELVGVSSKSWSDAAQQAVARASENLRHITGVDVLHSSAVVRNGKIMVLLRRLGVIPTVTKPSNDSDDGNY